MGNDGAVADVITKTCMVQLSINRYPAWLLGCISLTAERFCTNPLDLRVMVIKNIVLNENIFLLQILPIVSEASTDSLSTTSRQTSENTSPPTGIEGSARETKRSRRRPHPSRSRPSSRPPPHRPSTTRGPRTRRTPCPSTDWGTLSTSARRARQTPAWLMRRRERTAPCPRPPTNAQWTPTPRWVDRTTRTSPTRRRPSSTRTWGTYPYSWKAEMNPS